MKQRLLTALLITIALTACVGACARVDSLWHNQVDANKCVQDCDCDKQCADVREELERLLNSVSEGGERE